MLLRNSYCDIIIITLDVLWHACWIQHFLYVHYMNPYPALQFLYFRFEGGGNHGPEKKAEEGGQGEEIGGDLDHEIGVWSPRRDGGRGQCVSG